MRYLKATLNDLAHCYDTTSISHSEFKWRREHYYVINSLCHNESFVITKPDKGSGVVVLSHSDYADKMVTILNNASNFVKLNPVDSHDSTVTLENKFKKSG